MGIENANPAAPSGSYQGEASANVVRELMPAAQARRLIFGDAKVMAEITAELFEDEKRSNPYIDPDLQVLKSLSPMAKITFQRQRNVAHHLAQMRDESWDRPQRYIHAFRKHYEKLMWGR